MSYTCDRLLVRVSAPASEPITLSEAKLYLRVDHSSDDTLINDLITASRMAAEDWLKRSLITQSWKLSYDDYAPANVTLPMGPVNSVTSVVLVNRDGSTQTISGSNYYLNAAMNALVLDTALIGFRIEITYATGYGAAAAVPKPLKQGMLAHIAALYDNRGEDLQAALPEAAVCLYMPFREVRL